jgi:hypothetical protein
MQRFASRRKSGSVRQDLARPALTTMPPAISTKATAW